MRLLLLGAAGQVGWELQRALAPLGEVATVVRQTPPGPRAVQLDLAQSDMIEPALAAWRPDVIVNAAAYTEVDKAEKEPEVARAVNALAPAAMAQYAARSGALLVHYSTDYVFDGSGQRPWHEDDAPAPLNQYGHSKLAGERAIAQSGCRHLILRTSWVYAARGKNFAKTMLKLAQEREMLKVVDDQWGAPTGADLIADITAHAIRAVLHQPTLCGTYHCVADGETTWYGYAKQVIAQARLAGLDIRVADDAIQAVPSTAFPTPARRPQNSRLDTTRLHQCLGLCLPHWQTGVTRLVDELVAQ
jgi:dTDP-4-dehydrorhamnose reductase